MLRALKRNYRSIGSEPFIWLIALAYLALTNPASGGDFTLCPLKNLGFDHCPGCGLGTSVSFLLHGDVAQSLQYHLLGIPATVLLLFRIFSLLKKTQNHHQSQQFIINNRSHHA